MAVLLLLLVSCSAAKKDKTAKAVAAIDGVAKEEAKEEVAIEEKSIEEVAAEEEDQNETAADETDVYDVVGIKMDLSELIDNSKGLVMPSPIGVFDSTHDIYVMPIYYVAMPKEEAAGILYNSDSTQEELQKVYAAQIPLNVIVASDLDYDATVQNLSKILEVDYSEEMARAEVIGTSDGFTFYAVPDKNEAKHSTFDGEYAEEFEKLQQELLAIEKSATLFAPVDPVKEMTGQKLEFTTTDLDGNTMTSEDLFSANEITMVNCWGLWCGNCMKEMEELKELHNRMQEKGCGIVGLEFEYSWDDATVQTSKDVFNEYGITYPNVLIPEELVEQLQGFPTSFFVDKEGTILCMPIVGAEVDEYEAALEALLSGSTVADPAADDTANAITENPEILYNVYVTDENGPVGGVTIQFCSETCCMMGKTDASGLVSFSMPAGEIYEVHVLRIPEGYEKDDTVYHTTNESSDVQIQLKKH